MPWTELPEEEKLLYLAGVLPPGRRARIFIRSRFDRTLRLELRRLREEERGFAERIMPRLAERIGARARLAPAGRKRMPPATTSAWERMSPSTAFAGITSCALLAGILLAAWIAGPGGIGGGHPCLAMAEGHPPRPVLILGY